MLMAGLELVPRCRPMEDGVVNRLRKAPRRRVALVVAAGALFIAAWILLDVPPLSTLRTWSDETGAWFPVLFWLLYVLITQFPIPRTLMTVTAGILFGTGRGILIALTATTVSAVVSLFIVRTLLPVSYTHLTLPTKRIV